MMNQEILSREISGLSLNQAVLPQTSSKKSKRPNRAYHTLAAGVSAPTTPALQSTSQDYFPLEPNGHTFSPMGMPHASMSAPRLAADSPAMLSQEHFSSSSPYGVHSAAQVPAYTSSQLVAAQRWEDQIQFLARTFETAKDTVPPLPTTQFYAVDQGVCDPRLMSLSMYGVPVDERRRAATKLPLGLTLQPFAKLIPEEPIPVVGSSNDQGPLRCRRCRAYINPGFKMGYDSTATCNICKVKSQIPIDEYPPTDPQGFSNGMKVELTKGCVDFAVPEMYNAIKGQKPLPLHYVFLVDISLLANENGSSVAITEGIRTCIEYIGDFQPNCKVAIMAFDSKIRFFNLNPDLESAQEYVIGDLTDVFLPFYEGLFAKPQDSIRVIDDTLKKITHYITTEKYSHVAQSCYGSAIEAAKLALDTVTGGQGGKIICSLNSLPTVGNGNLTLRKDDNSKKHMKCDNEFYTKLGHGLMRSYISLDLYITSSVFIDMVTIGYPVEATCGVLKYYPGFTQDKDEFTLVNDMLHNVSNIVGYQALLKIRCSTNISIYQYYAESAGNTDRDPMFPVLTTDTTMDVLLKYDQKLMSGSNVSFQAALLYTDIDGNRKVRSINANANVSENVKEIFQFVDQNVVMRIMIKDVISSLGDCDFTNIRKTIDDKMVDVLTQYKALVGSNLGPQLVLPEALKTLASFMLAFEKSDLMTPNTHSTRGNDRCYDLFHYKTMNSAQLSYKLYPQIVPLHVLLGEDELTFYDTTDKLLQVSPNSIENLSVRNSHSSITNGGCYLIFQGETVYLWFNENTNRLLLRDLLQVEEGVPVSEVTLFGSSLPQLPTQVNAKALAVIKNWSQVTNHSFLPVELLRPNVDRYYSRVMTQLLCEDKSITKVESHDTYLVNLHRQIQDKLKKEDYVKVASSNNAHTGDMHQKFIQF